MLPDRPMATTWNAYFRSEMNACEGHESQSQALIQYAPSEIPTGALFPQLFNSLKVFPKVTHLGAGGLGAPGPDRPGGAPEGAKCCTA